jgi:hypothetical protein
MRTIVVGDVHGCLAELDELLAQLAIRRGVDRLVFAGDLVDRGPDPVGVVRRVRELKAEAVLGNHEEKHLRWARHEAKKRTQPGYKNPMKPFNDKTLREHEALRPDDLAFLERLPLRIRLEPGWVVVHAGFEPGRPVDRQFENACLRVRYVRSDGKMASIDKLGEKPSGTVRWATRWPGPENVVYGHAVYDLTTPQRDTPAPNILCLGIDTGCCFGGHLTALILPTLELVQVKARAEYHPFTLSEN